MSDLKIPAAARAWMRKIARVGGLAGGPARARALSPERRVEIAKLANAARQAKALERAAVLSQADRLG